MAVAAPPAQAAEPPRGAAAALPRAPRLLLAGLVACLIYAAFAGGATDLPQETRLQVALLALAGAACAAWLFGGGIAFSASPLAWAGAAALGAFAIWCGASVGWSVAPDGSWAELNRGVAYTVAVVLGIGVGSSLSRAHARASLGLTIAGGLVALYAIGGKTLPGLVIGGLLDLDQAGELNRLRAPLGYWNALGLVCVMTIGPALAVALDRARGTVGRIAALCTVAVLELVLVLTYSRGGLIALAVAIVVLLALGGDQARVLAHLAAASIAIIAPAAVALSSGDLTTDGLPLGRREDDALIVLFVLLSSLGVLTLLGGMLHALERLGAFTPGRDRQVVLGLGAVVLAALAAGVMGAATSERGLGGTITDRAERFTEARSDPTTDPQRVLSTSSGNRWVWWEEAAGAWSDRPVAGWGAGSFPVTHKLYREQPLSVRQPHSMPMQWLAETGVVGLVLAGGALLALLAAGWSRARAVRAAGADPLPAAALVAAGAAWVAHAVYDWDWDVPGATLPAMVALGVVAGRPAVAARRSPSARGLTLAAVVALLLAAAVSAVLPAVAASRTEAALDAAAEAGRSPDRLAAAASSAELAARLDRVSVEPLFATASIAQRLGDLGQARRQIQRAIQRQPESADAWARLVRIELLRGDRAGYTRAADRLVALDPRNPVALDLARRAAAAVTPPEGSATATGSPLPQTVPTAP